MSVKIRLKKLGRKHRPFFRVCAMDTRTRRDGREIEVLGTYDPMVPETDARAMLDAERVDYWLGVGAKPTPKVGTLIKKYGSNGTHLEQQKAALEKLGGLRAASIASAVSEAESTKVDAKAEAEKAEAEKAEAEKAEAEKAAAEKAEAEKAEAEKAAAESSSESADSAASDEKSEAGTEASDESGSAEKSG